MGHIVVLPGDGIGPEIVAQAVRVLDVVNARFGLGLTHSEALIGGAAIDATGDPLPETTLIQAKAADAVLLGAVGGPAWDGLPMSQRPEKGLLRIRAGMELFANFRPAILYPELAHASTLKSDLIPTATVSLRSSGLGALPLMQRAPAAGVCARWTKPMCWK